MITFKCACGTTLQVKQEHAGRKVQCPKCQSQMAVPTLADSPMEAVPSVLLVDQPGSRTRETAPEPPRRERRERWEENEEAPRRAPAPKTSGQAIAALVLGLITFCLPVLMAIPAVIFGILALGNIKRSGGRLTGGGLAVSGIVLGFVGSIGGGLLQFFLLVPAVQQVRESAAKTQCGTHLKMIGLAFHSFHDSHRTLPPAVVCDANGKPLYSWRVLLLPYLDQNPMYQQFKLDEPWDSPSNKRFLDVMPAVYAHPSLAEGKDPKLCYFQVFDGPTGNRSPRALFASRTGTRVPFALAGDPGKLSCAPSLALMRVPDGTSNTIMVAEAADGVPWTKPADLNYEPNQPLPQLGGHFRNGFHVGLADGSVRFADRRRITDPTLRIAITADDGQVLPPNWDN